MRLAYQSEVNFRPYWVDIYLSEFHLAIEVDGPSHSRKKDELRDKNLWANYNLPVLRLELNCPVDQVKARVTRLIEQWAESAQERKYG